MDAVKEKLAALKEWAIDTWLDFRAESGFFQVKVALVAGYVFLIVLPTVVLAPPSPQGWEVKIHKASFGLTYRTVVEIRNLALGTLDDVRVEVSGTGVDFDNRKRTGTFTGKLTILPEGQKVQLGPDKLLDSGGRAAPATLTVNRVQVFEGDSLVIDYVPGGG